VFAQFRIVVERARDVMQNLIFSIPAFQSVTYSF
jgi:hypothetical protein